MNKKAISGVIVAILLVLIAVIAVSIFWFALRPTIEKSVEGVGTGKDCISLDLTISSIDTAANTVTLFRDAGTADLKEIRIIVDGTEDANSPFDASGQGELTTEDYSVTVSADDIVEIAATLDDGTQCPVTDSRTA